MSRTAVVAGASGLVGGHCLQALLNAPAYDSVVALVRRHLDLAHSKLTQAALDADVPAGADIFCAIGTTMRKAGSREAFRQVDYDIPVRLAERAAVAGADQFAFISSVGANAESRNFYLRVKGETERAIAALPFRAVHLFRPGFLAGERPESRPGERIGMAVAQRLSFLLRGSLEKYRAISAETVGRAMVAAAQRGERGVCIYEYRMIEGLGAGIR